MYFVALQSREKDAEGRTRLVKTLRLPVEADAASFRSWALVFVALGAITGFALKIADAPSTVFAVGAGFGLFSIVAGVYAWVYAKRLGDRVVAHAKAKAAHETRRAALCASPPEPARRVAAAATSPSSSRAGSPPRGRNPSRSSGRRASR